MSAERMIIFSAAGITPEEIKDLHVRATKAWRNLCRGQEGNLLKCCEDQRTLDAESPLG